VTLAFAREVVKPSSVQEKLREQGAEVFAWIAKGASFYLSGEKSPMSQEVEKELLSIIGTHGACSPEDAVKYLENLKKEGRYQKDVY
jgi:sulfite reductase (NADPH) flavoprotein alpha-component